MAYFTEHMCTVAVGRTSQHCSNVTNAKSLDVFAKEK